MLQCPQLLPFEVRALSHVPFCLFLSLLFREAVRRDLRVWALVMNPFEISTIYAAL